MEEKFFRLINPGDLVLFNNNSNGFKDIRYGIVVGESVIYSEGVYYRRVNTCFKVNKLCDEEKIIYNNLINSFKNEAKDSKKIKSKNEIGGLYVQSNPHVYYLYLGSGKLYNINKNLIDSSSDVYLMVSASFNPNMLDKDFSNNYSDINFFFPWFEKELGIVEMKNNIGFSGYNHLIFTKRDKKFINQVGKLNIPAEMFQNFLYLSGSLNEKFCAYLYLDGRQG